MGFKNIISIIIVITALYKVITSFTQNLEYGTLFSVQTNIWVYRIVWVLAGSLSTYSIYKSIKDKKTYGK